MILITQPRAGRSHNEIIALQMAAQSLGWEVFPAPGTWRMPDEFLEKNIQGVPYGSQLFCEVIVQQMKWKLKQNPFNWLTKIPRKYLKRKVDFMTLAEAKKINVKKFIYRCFVRDGNVWTSSCYIQNKRIAEPNEYQNYSEDNEADLLDELLAAKEIRSENAVIDVGLIDGKDWAVIESNPAWASGLYGCDPVEALLTMEKAVEMEK